MSELTFINRHRFLLIRLAIGLILFVVVYSLQASITTTLGVVSSSKPLFLALGLLAGLTGDFITALKWRYLLRSAGRRLDILTAIRATFIGMFYNCFLPGSVGGDIAKSLLVVNQAGGKAPALASVFMQRNTGLAALMIVANAGAWMTDLRLRLFSANMEFLNDMRFWFALTALFYVLINMVLLSRTVNAWLWHLAGRQRYPQSAMQGIGRFILEKARRMHDSLLLFRRGIPISVLISLGTQMTDCLVIFFAARAIGIDLPYSYFCVFAPAVSVAALLPLTINGIGLRDIMYITLLAGAGKTANQAAALAWLHLGYILTFALCGGAIHWATVKRGKNPVRRDLIQAL
ncbi:MAG: lysylphosphatidylglycerol synthase transmembrane domain-containing protein [bacterium]|nr:lysylphosphatidylglycerol synthase transmembrane domain-containing protein [Candidatus Sumerlaeota bacterium]